MPAGRSVLPIKASTDKRLKIRRIHRHPVPRQHRVPFPWVHPNFLGELSQATLGKLWPAADQRLQCTFPKAASIRVAPEQL